MQVCDIDPKKYEYFSWEGKTFEAKPCDTYDGDTTGFIWIYNDQVIKQKCRCLGYDSPEIRCGKDDPERDEKKAKGIAARDRFIELLNQDPTVTIYCGKGDKYGRVLVTIYNQTNGTKSLNDIMIEEGYGYEYYGGTKRK